MVNSFFLACRFTTISEAFSFFCLLIMKNYNVYYEGDFLL